MMSGVNKVILLGNLGKDPEIRYTPSGTAVCNFSVATSRVWKGKDGDRKEETEWHTIVCFNKLAETCAEYLKKGFKVFIEGRIKTEKWEKDGEERRAIKIYAQAVQFMGARKEGQTHEAGPQDTDDVPF
ncbi:MAG: single-stranded DNA-binding protein [Deltaproteobacteria bacterium]|nr:single-stranded DNA-binding protein [Deltaproteobacteria bacterium]